MTQTFATLVRFLRAPAVAVPRPRLPPRSRARHSVLAGIVFVVLGTVGLNVVVDTVKPQWRDPEYGHRLKELRAQVHAAPGRPLVVALGSSRVEMGLSPAHLGLGDGPDAPLVYNCSQAGCGPLQELMTLQRLLAAGVKPDYVLVEMLPPVMSLATPPEELIPSDQLAYQDLDRLEPFANDPATLRNRWLRTRVAPWHTYRLSLLCHWGLGSWLPWQVRKDFLWKQMQPGGWMPYLYTDMPAQKRAEGQAKAKAEYVPYFVGYNFTPQTDRSFRQIIELCRDRGIPVAFYVMPESPLFRSWYPPHVPRVFADYSATLGVPVFNASTWLDDELMFADGHHLLRPGAEAFSRRFGAECLAPWLQGERR